MVTEERRAEILENRKTFQRLTREIVEGKRRKETIQVLTRDGEPYELVVHALTELVIAETAQKAGLSLQDLLKRLPQIPCDCKGEKSEADPKCPKCNGRRYTYGTDEKSLLKLRFINEIISSALVGSEQEQLTAKELDESLPATERTKTFRTILEISGLSAKARADMEKFRGEPSQ